MGNVVPPRPRDPDAFLGRSGNVAAVGVLPSIARIGVPPTVQTPASAASTSPLTFVEIDGGQLGGSGTTLIAPFTANVSGLWTAHVSGDANYSGSPTINLFILLNGDVRGSFSGSALSTTPVAGTASFRADAGDVVNIELLSVGASWDSAAIAFNAYGLAARFTS